jgi:HEAT repeat protein
VWKIRTTWSPWYSPGRGGKRLPILTANTIRVGFASLLDPHQAKRYRTGIVLNPCRVSVLCLLPFFLLAAPRTSAAWDAASNASGAIEIRDGDKIAAHFVPKTPAERRGKPTVRLVTISGHRVLEVRLPVLDEGPKLDEVWVAELPVKEPIWWDEAGARDVDGDTTREVVVSENGIEVFQTASRVHRCDGVPAHLFRQIWNFSTHRFAPAAPALPPAAPVTIKAQRADAQMPTGKPLGGFHFHAVSTSAGAKGDARQLSAPTAVNDDDPATVWTADAGEDRGAYFTARSSAGFAITGLKILPGDPRDAKTFAAASRPRRLTLLWGRGAEQSLDVDLVEKADGAAKHSREPFWIPLPKPVASSCLTVMVRDAPAGHAPMAIADLTVITEIDGPQAVDRLLADLAAGTSCETRRPLLVSLGVSALDKVAEALAKTPAGPGRGCLVETVNALLLSPQPAAGQPMATSPALATALAAALDGATPDEEKILFVLLPRLQNLPLSTIVALLDDEKRSDLDRLRAAQVLALIAQPEARQALVAALGQGSPMLRAGVRKIAAGAKPPMAKPTLEALDQVPASASAQRADLLIVLAAAATREPEQVHTAFQAMAASLRGPASFEEQARALAGLGLIRHSAAVAELTTFRSTSKDGVLRFLATRELAGIPDPATGPGLRAALLDSDPRVREAAAQGLGNHGDKSAAQPIMDGAKQEPWPFVRRTEIIALGELCVPEGNKLLLRAYEKDVDDIRMAALVGLARCRDWRASALLVRVLGRLPESADMRSLAARLLAEMKDRRATAPMAEALKRLRTESQADLSLEGTATETVMALASLGGKDAVTAAVGLLGDSRPSLQKAAVQALGMLCDPGPGAVALRAATKNKDESVAVAATLAEQHCQRPH